MPSFQPCEARAGAALFFPGCWLLEPGHCVIPFPSSCFLHVAVQMHVCRYQRFWVEATFDVPKPIAARHVALRC